MAYSTYRPNGRRGQGDSHLPSIARKLRRVLSKTQSDFLYHSLRFDADVLGELAGIWVDFAQDLHNCIGIWTTYERYNVEFFGTAVVLNEENILTFVAALNNVARLTRNDDSGHAQHADNQPLAGRKVNKYVPVPFSYLFRACDERV